MTTPHPSPPLSAEVLLANDRAAIEQAEHQLLHAVATLGYPEASSFALRLAFEEAVINAFRHGHRGLPPDATIRLAWTVDRNRAVISVTDQGPGFEPDDVPDPTLEQNLERPTGRGIMLMKAYVTEVRYEGRGNQVTMIYDRAAEERRRRDLD